MTEKKLEWYQDKGVDYIWYGRGKNWLNDGEMVIDKFRYKGKVYYAVSYETMPDLEPTHIGNYSSDEDAINAANEEARKRGLL